MTFLNALSVDEWMQAGERENEQCARCAVPTTPRTHFGFESSDNFNIIPALERGAVEAGVETSWEHDAKDRLGEARQSAGPECSV